MAMGRLSRMNGGVIGPLTGAHSMMSNKVNSNADQKNLNSNHSQLFASSAFAASANSRAEVSAMDTGTSFDGGLDMSDFASSRPQTADSLRLQNRDDQGMDVDGALTRVLPICQEEEEDEDNIPGAKQILGRGSPCESKHSTGSRHHQSHPKKSLADVKPVSYPNHLNNASSQQPSTVIQSQNSVGDLSSCSSSKKSPRSVNAVHGHHHHHKQCVHPPAMGSKQDAKCSVM